VSGGACMAKFDPNQTREWTLNDRIARLATPMLEADGYRVMRVDDISGAKNISLANRGRAANEAGADLFFSIHHNAGINGGSGGGIVVYTTKNPNSARKLLQKTLYDLTIKHTGLVGYRSNPLPTQNWAVLNAANKMPCVLGEFGYMDSSTDVPIIITLDFATKCARAIADSVIAVMGSIGQTHPTLSKGALGAYVGKLQSLIGGLSIDESFGPLTEAAVKAYQKKQGLSQDGVVGPKTWAALLNPKTAPTPAPIPAPPAPAGGKTTLRQGDKDFGTGGPVAQLQRFLGGLKVDGAFGPVTKAAVVAYQRKRGLYADGVCGPLTWEALLVPKNAIVAFKPTRTIIYDNTKNRKTTKTIRAETGARYATNAMFFSMSGWFIYDPLKIDGKVVKDDGSKRDGYGWDGGAPAFSNDITRWSNFISSRYPLVKNGVVVTTSYSGVDEDKNRGRTAMGSKADGAVVIYCAADGSVDACTVWLLKERMKIAGCKDAIKFDGGGSSQIEASDGSISAKSSRIVINHLCFWA